MSSLAPDRVLRVAFGLWSARLLQSATDLGVFTELGRGPRTLAQLRHGLKLDALAACDLLDALVGLQLLEREGDGEAAIYMNAREAGRYLDARAESYLGGWLQQDAAGPPRPSPADAADMPWSADDAWARLLGDALAQRAQLAPARSVLDVHGGTGHLLCALAAAQPRLEGVTRVAEARLERARAHIAACALGPRVRAQAAQAPWPRAEVVVLNRCSPQGCADVGDELARARAALSSGGRVWLIDHLLDDARRHDVAALLAVWRRRAAGERFVASTVQAAQTKCAAAGFARAEWVPLWGGASVLQAWA